jgi:hypothetical protein
VTAPLLPSAAFIGSLSLLLSACTASSDLVSAPVGPSSSSAAALLAPGPRWLVWARGSGDAGTAEGTLRDAPVDDAKTWTVDAAGHVEAEVPGALVAARGAVWAWRTEGAEVKTEACPRYDGEGHELPAEGPPPDPGHVTRVTLRRTDTGEALSVIAPPPESDGVAALDHGARLVASVGPYLFVHESTYVYACGAHGNVGCASLVWDAERGQAVWSSDGKATPGMVDRAEWSSAERRASERLKDLDDVSSFVTDGKLDVDLTELLPAYGPDATLGLSLQFTAGTCYACSDGAWSSYSASMREPVAALPGDLAAWASAPDGVRAFALQHPELAIGGWSAAPVLR